MSWEICKKNVMKNKMTIKSITMICKWLSSWLSTSKISTIPTNIKLEPLSVQLSSSSPNTPDSKLHIRYLANYRTFFMSLSTFTKEIRKWLKKSNKFCANASSTLHSTKKISFPFSCWIQTSLINKRESSSAKIKSESSKDKLFCTSSRSDKKIKLNKRLKKPSITIISSPFSNQLIKSKKSGKNF